MTNPEQEQLIVRARKLLLAAHNAKQALDGATKRHKVLVGKIKSLKDQVRQQEENLRKLTDEQIPTLKKEYEAAELVANQSLKVAQAVQRGNRRIEPQNG